MSAVHKKNIFLKHLLGEQGWACFSSFVRLPLVEQPRELHHRPQVWLLGRGDYGLLYLLPQDPVAQTQQPHRALLLQWGEAIDRWDGMGWGFFIRCQQLFVHSLWKRNDWIDKRWVVEFEVHRERKMTACLNFAILLLVIF